MWIILIIFFLSYWNPVFHFLPPHSVKCLSFLYHDKLMALFYCIILFHRPLCWQLYVDIINQKFGQLLRQTISHTNVPKAFYWCENLKTFLVINGGRDHHGEWVCGSRNGPLTSSSTSNLIKTALLTSS